jgi:hypothetical protein
MTRIEDMNAIPVAPSTTSSSGNAVGVAVVAIPSELDLQVQAPAEEAMICTVILASKDQFI